MSHARRTIHMRQVSLLGKPSKPTRAFIEIAAIEFVSSGNAYLRVFRLLGPWTSGISVAIFGARLFGFVCRHELSLPICSDSWSADCQYALRVFRFFGPWTSGISVCLRSSG